MDSSIGRILSAVDRRKPEMFAFLQELVRVPSVTGDEGAVQNVVAAKMRELGLTVDLWEPSVDELAPHALHVGEFANLNGRPNVVGKHRGIGGGNSLILNAHIDVVDAGDSARWTYPPFAAEIHNGKLYGRGACDMKAGL